MSKITLSKGRIVARHPHCDRVLNWGVKRLPPDKQADLLRQVQRLIDKAPKILADAPTGLDSRVTDPYFAALAADFGLDVDHDVLVDGIVNAGNLVALQRYMAFKGEFASLQKTCNEVTGERDDLKRQLGELVKRAGEKSKHDYEITIDQGWQQFERRFKLRKESTLERANVMRRVKCVLEKLGMSRTFGELKLANIEDAITASEPISEAEKSKRSSDIKRFFRFCCLAEEANGLGISKDPSAFLKYMTPKQLQRLRRRAGMVVAADDPADILPKLELYWRALYATLCYTGTRVSECASLMWDRIDAETKIVSVLESDVKADLKNEHSFRAIRPFKELWPILTEYKASLATPPVTESLAFPRPSNGKSWFLASGKINHFTRGLTRALIRAGMSEDDAEEPGRRARRYWETRMRSIGRTDLIAVMSGHDPKIGFDHYTESLKVVKAVSGPEF